MTKKLTASQLKTMHYYQTGVWVDSLQSNHKIGSERALRGMGLLQLAGKDGKLEATEEGLRVDTSGIS